MKVKGEGFTSETGSKEAEQIVSRNSGVFRSFEATIRECKSFVKSVDVSGQETEEERQKIIALVVVVRLLEITEAALLIMRNGMSNEANTMLRVFLDAYFVFANICSDTTFVVNYFKSDEHARLKLLNSFEKHDSELFKRINEYATEELNRT
jgi:hypothetical protein